MAEPPEFWAFLVANSLLFLAGGVLTALSYRAYLRVREHTFRIAAGGFALITLGGLMDLIYQVGIRQDYHLGGKETLALQTAGSLVIAGGLVVLFYSLSQH